MQSHPVLLVSISSTSGTMPSGISSVTVTGSPGSVPKAPTLVTVSE